MDSMLQEHGAKHVYRVPEGLRELCSDISREVLRSQPREIYCYIADYIDAMLITRENAKVAVRVVNNILLGSEAIVGILHRTGLNLEQIAAAAPRIQKAFGAYLDAVDIQPVQVCEDKSFDEKSCISIRNILECTGTTLEIAEKAAITIQAAFRGHYERMLEREAKGEIQWQKAASNTMEILRKAGVSQAEATDAATLIQSAYRGYYTRRNRRMKSVEEDKEERTPRTADDLLESRGTIQAVAWLDMMYEDSGITAERANEAATLIQSAYRGYKTRRRCYDVKPNDSSSTNSLVVDAIVENVRQRIFTKILSREDIPGEFGSPKEVEVVAERIENAYKERLRESRLSSEIDNDGIYDSVDSVEDDDAGGVDPRGNRSKNETKLSRISIDDDPPRQMISEKRVHSHQLESDDDENDQV